MLGARDADVRLAFYAPLPFAGITAPPSPLDLPLHPIAWQVWPEPLRPAYPIQARFIRASLMIEGPGGPGAAGR